MPPLHLNKVFLGDTHKPKNSHTFHNLSALKGACQVIELKNKLKKCKIQNHPGEQLLLIA